MAYCTRNERYLIEVNERVKALNKEIGAQRENIYSASTFIGTVLLVSNVIFVANIGLELYKPEYTIDKTTILCFNWLGLTTGLILCGTYFRSTRKQLVKKSLYLEL